MVFHWSLSDSKSPQVSRTRLRILAVLSHAVVWIVSTRPPTSKFSRPFNNPLVIVPDIGLGVRVFANGPGDLGSIPGRVIPKTQKMVLDASLLNTQHYKVRIKGKVEPSREGVAPSHTPWCSSYRKGSLRATLDYGHQLLCLTHQSQ